LGDTCIYEFTPAWIEHAWRRFPLIIFCNNNFFFSSFSIFLLFY
jgi:hypothetical protein